MSIIPAPIQQERLPGCFVLPPELVITYNCGLLADVAALAAETMESRYGRKGRCEDTMEAEASAVGAIHLSWHACLASLAEMPNSREAYELTVAEGAVTIRANTPHGVFNGLQSLLLLMPATAPPEGHDILCESVKIVDAPRFRWRGALLDVGRHFFSVTFLKKFLDVLALHKINVFHWHLTEDQGWRAEVKQLERLAEVGAWRSSDGGTTWYGGFYSQSEMRDIVEYARKRFIDVMPEIECPGHCSASLAAYPHLSCSGQVTEVPTQWGVHEHVYCAGNDKVFEFLETVFSEMIDIFPFEYIHIGGDEVPKVQWKQCPKCQDRMREEGLEHEGELQSWFIKRVAAFLASKGKKIVGWDEILEGGLVKGATVMSWRGTKGGVVAARMGHDVIMTPTSHCYFDYKQSSSPQEPGAWYAMLPIQTVYEFDPAQRGVGTGVVAQDCAGLSDASLTDEDAERIIGAQANVWTEYISDEATVEYMLLLRLCALSETMWSQRDAMSWDGFRDRIRSHVKHLDAMGLKYRNLEEDDC